MLSIRNAALALAVVNTDRLHKSRQRTSQIQDWTVGVVQEGALAVKGCLLEDESIVANIEWDAYATRRRCRREIIAHGPEECWSGEEGREAAQDLYWAAVAVLYEEGVLVQGAARRGACNQAQRHAGDWGTGSVRDQHWILMLRASPLYDSSTADATWRCGGAGRSV